MMQQPRTRTGSSHVHSPHVHSCCTAAPAAGWLQAEQLLSCLGVTSKRLHVPHPQLLAPLVSQLQPQQRLLLLHYNTAHQELCVAAWGVVQQRQQAKQAGQESAGLEASVPGASAMDRNSSSGGAAAAVMGTTAATSAAAAAAAAAVPSGSESARGRRTSVAKDAAVVAAAAAGASGSAVQQAVLLGSMHCPLQHLEALMAGFRAYRRQLHKAVIEVTSQPTPPPCQLTPGGGTAGEAPAATGTAGAAAGAGSAAKKPPASAVGKAKGGSGAAAATAAASEVPPWVPPVHVFGQELNVQWQQLLDQVCCGDMAQ